MSVPEMLRPGIPIRRGARRAATMFGLLALTCGAMEARAEETNTPAPSQERPAPKASLSVLVDPRISLDAGALRNAISAELGVHVVADDPSSSSVLRIVPVAKDRFTVSYERRGGERVSRAISVPREPERAVEVIALLAGNLVRNEAEDILVELRAQRSEEAPSPPSAGSEDRKRGAAEAGQPTPDVPPKEKNDDVSGKPPPSPTPSRERQRTRVFRPVHVSLFEPLSYPLESSDDYALEIGLIFGKVGGLYGVGLGGVLTWVERDFEGALLNGFGSYVGGSAKGAQLSGFGNLVGGSFEGAELSGFGNYVAGSAEGAQVSGAVNVAKESIDGVQATSVLNYAGDVEGLQLAVVNIGTGRVRGAQIGLVNYAEELDGFSFGLVNIAGNGRVQAMSWYSTAIPVNVAAKFTNGPIFTLTSFGYGPDNDLHRLSAGLALGAHLPLGRFYLEADAGYAHDSVLGQDVSEQEDFVRYRALAGFELTKAFAIFGGGGLRHRLPTEGHTAEHDPEAVVGIQLF